MKLTRWQCLSTDRTCACLRRVRLKKLGAPLVYAGAKLSLERTVSTKVLVPAQRYVLKADLNSVSALAALFALEGIDIFAMEGALLFWHEQEGHTKGPIALAPPMIEESHEAGNCVVWLINDGMHRLTVARRQERLVNVLLARDVPAIWPYYALPLPGGWAAVEELDVLPDGYQKKIYRWPENRKALFRDFNAVFPGIQKERRAL